MACQTWAQVGGCQRVEGSVVGGAQSPGACEGASCALEARYRHDGQVVRHLWHVARCAMRVGGYSRCPTV